MTLSVPSQSAPWEDGRAAECGSVNRERRSSQTESKKKKKATPEEETSITEEPVVKLEKRRGLRQPS